MIEWERLEPGHYKSKTLERFKINNTVYGRYKWRLEDYKQIAEGGYYKGLYYESTLLECKLKAEQILADEERKI